MLVAVLLLCLYVASVDPMEVLKQFSTLARFESAVSGYQGVHPSFAGIYMWDRIYTEQNRYDASVVTISGADLNFDPDDQWYHKPNLRGELRDIQVVENLRPYVNAPSFFGLDPMPIQNPYRTYEWRVKDSAGNVHVYRMELWLCSLQVNLWAEPSYVDNWAWKANTEYDDKRYDNTEVWLRLKPHEGRYFYATVGGKEVEAARTYFAVAYMELYQWKLGGDVLSYVQATGSSSEADAAMLIGCSPKAQWSAFTLAESLRGAESSQKPLAKAKSYEGMLLNPDVFKEEWYTRIILSDFGTRTDWWKRLQGTYAADNAQWTALAHIFAIGEWVVKPELERNMETHPSKSSVGWLDWFAWWAKTPWGTLTLSSLALIIIAIVVIAALAYFGLLTPLLAWLFARRRKP